jgi:uncharacterized protein YecE (DUF72 family)
MIKIGCCGFAKRKEEYFKNFDLVELQRTFYKLPKVETAERWINESPKKFEYTMKAWQLITHSPRSPTYRKSGIKIKKEDRYGYFRPTKEVFDSWDRTREIAKVIKASIVVFQCPPSFEQKNESIKNMEEFFSSIERGIKFAWEPRGNWDDEIIKKICDELDLIHCVDPFKRRSVHGMRYFRLHGIGGYKYDYSIEELEKLKKLCHGDAYCLFNNTNMYENALQFKDICQ